MLSTVVIFPRYRSLAPMYYRGASAAIVVYDITNKDSFNGAKSWVKELQRRGDPNVVIALAGNKSDLEHKRAVSLLLCDDTTREGVRETRGTTRVPRFLSGCACSQVLRTKEWLNLMCSHCRSL